MVQHISAIAQGRWGAIAIKSATLVPGAIVSVACVMTGPMWTSWGRSAPTPPPRTQSRKAQRRSSWGRNNSPISTKTAASSAAAAASRAR